VKREKESRERKNRFQRNQRNQRRRTEELIHGRDKGIKKRSSFEKLLLTLNPKGMITPLFWFS
jgi:hypothetical protein